MRHLGWAPGWPRRLAVATVTAPVIAWVVAALLVPRQWESSALLLFVPGQAGIGRLSSLEHHAVGTVDRRTDVAVSILQSRALRGRVVRDTGMCRVYPGLEEEEACEFLRRAVTTRVGASGQLQVTVRLPGTPSWGPRHASDSRVRALARDLADGCVARLGDRLSGVRDAERTSLAQALAVELVRLDQEAAPEAARQTVAGDLAVAQALTRWDDPPFHILDRPCPPDHPVSPTPWLGAALTAATALALWGGVLGMRWVRAPGPAPTADEARDAL